MSRPVRVLSLGAGVQSTTVALMMIAGEIEPADAAIFADTGWESAAVYRHLDWLSGELASAGIELRRVSAGDLRADALGVGRTGRKRYVPIPVYLVKPNGEASGMARRQCTKEYKLEPTYREVRDLVGLAARSRAPVGAHLADMVIGISWDETQRMRDAHRPWLRNVYPLVDLRMTRADCLAWCAARGFPTPPRSACVGCPYHDDRSWREIRDDPEAWADVVEFDGLLRSGSVMHEAFRGPAYLHRSRRPLDEVDLRSEEERGQLTLWGDECEGMRGV